MTIATPAARRPRPASAPTRPKLLSGPHNTKLGGAIYDRADLARIKVADAAALLGSDLAGEMSANGIFLDPVKAAAVLRTLPRPDVRLFEQVAKAAGVDPVVTPDVGRRQMTEDEIDELASQYQPS